MLLYFLKKERETGEIMHGLQRENASGALVFKAASYIAINRFVLKCNKNSYYCIRQVSIRVTHHDRFDSVDESRWSFVAVTKDHDISVIQCNGTCLPLAIGNQ